ncbi:MAG TPA: acyl-CoA dehydrogenase domain-containing protein, partial [Trinickia sp.]|nr:acyl-CoA dehydrogenase domain-containing protein [Trinickia sp.]
EGIHEALGRMGGNLYLMDAARRLCAQAVDLGEKPSVLSAIAKYHITERARNVINDGMDVIGGKGICMGPSNFLARAYQQMPISITVEGANILTRSLIIFGQGAIRCHPYVLKEMTAAREPDREKALRNFDDAFFGHANFLASNALRAFVYGITAGAAIAVPAEAYAPLAAYYRAATRLSMAFALVADVTMLALGADLKRRERISARLGDVLSQLFLISATFKRFEDEGRQQADLPLVRWAVGDALYAAQLALDGVLVNYPKPRVAMLLRACVFPLGMPLRPPRDSLASEVAELVQTPCDARERLVADSYVPDAAVDPLGYGERLFHLTPRVAAIEHRLRDAVKRHSLAPMPQSPKELKAWADAVRQQGLIDAEECQTLDNYARYGELVVKVDDFGPEFDLLEALQKRHDALVKSGEPIA